MTPDLASPTGTGPNYILRNATVASACTIARSPAKVNWSLRVLGRRADGYHDIESLVSAISLEDELAFNERPEGVFELACDHPDVPTDGSNLVIRAARLLADQSGARRGMACRLRKQVPIGGGLGGGSSNAASTLTALNELWSLGWAREQLVQVASEVGSDVAFFLHGGSAVISGRGEQVRPTTLGWRGWIVLILPAFGMSTPAVYAAWRLPAAAPPPVEPPTCRTAEEWMAATFNMLEEPAMTVRPVLREMRDQLARLADRPVRMSGSGSTLFTAFDDREDAAAFAEQAGRRLDVRTCVARPADNA